MDALRHAISPSFNPSGRNRNVRRESNAAAVAVPMLYTAARRLHRQCAAGLSRKSEKQYRCQLHVLESQSCAEIIGRPAFAHFGDRVLAGLIHDVPCVGEIECLDLELQIVRHDRTARTCSR